VHIELLLSAPNLFYHTPSPFSKSLKDKPSLHTLISRPQNNNPGKSDFIVSTVAIFTDKGIKFKISQNAFKA